MPRRASLAGKWKSRIVSKQHRLALDFKCGSKLTFCNSARQSASTILVAKFESLHRLMTVFEAVMRVWRSRELRSLTIHDKRFAFRRLSRVFAHRAYNVIVLKFYISVIIIKLLPEVIYDEYQLISFVEACRISSKIARTRELPDEPDRRC